MYRWRGDAVHVPDDEPDDERRDGQRHDDRHEDAAHGIREPLDGCPRALRVAHEPNDLGERAVRAECGGAITECTGAIDGAANDAGARVLLHGHRLAGEHGFVHRAVAGQHLAVHRKAFTGTDDDDFASAHVVNGNVELSFTIRRGPDNARRLRLEIRKGAERGRRLLLRARLECVAREDQRDDDDDRFVVDVGCETAAHEEAGRHGGDEGVDERRTGPHGDERVHVRRMVPECRPCARVEVAAGPAHHGDGQGEQYESAQCHDLARHAHHGHEHRDATSDSAHDGLQPQLGKFRRLGLIACGLLLERTAIRHRHFGTVACAANGVHECIGLHDRRIIRHRGVAHHEIDRGIVHAGSLVQRALDVTLAGSARHARHGNDHLVRGIHRWR